MTLIDTMEKQVTRDEVLDIAQYEKVRPQFREQVLAAKKVRRMALGPHFTLLFENHLTALYQIQEMIRVERMVNEKDILHEIKTYNELIPTDGGLSVTLLIEYETEAERAEHLPQLLGVEEHIFLQVGDNAPIPARFDRRQIGEDRVSSVQYLRFPLGDGDRQAWQAAAKAGTLRLTCTHPHYTHDAAIPLAVAEALAKDFS